MAASINPQIPKIDWLYPELLSKEGLVEILSQRYVSLPEDTDSCSKEDLLELYYKYIIPRPQRKYRLNRRGRDMTKKQILHAKKRKITGPDYSEPPAKRSAKETSGLVNSFDGTRAGNRLKPPPSCVNFDKKVIKLGSSKSPDTSLCSQDATVDNTTNDTPAPVSAEPKVIKLSQSSVSTESRLKPPVSPQKTITLTKTIKLINSHLSIAKKEGEEPNTTGSKAAKETAEPMETDSADDSPTKKVRKIKRISWP